MVRKSNKEEVTDFVEDMENSFGEGAVIRGDQSRRTGMLLQPTNIPSLDNILGGGIPKGKIVEIFGPAGCGKTTFAMQLIKQLHNTDAEASALFIDTEHALNLDYCYNLGIDMQRLYISQPTCAEEAFEMIGRVAKKKFVSFVVLDSIAALVPRSEVELSLADSGAVASLARVMSGSLKRLLSVLATADPIYVLFVNQLRSNVSNFASFGTPSETTAGGKALEYFSYIRIEMKRIGYIRSAEKDIGFQVRFKIMKNKMAIPFKQSVVEMYFGSGFRAASDILNYGLDCGVIERKGIYYSFKGENFGKGKENAISVIDSDLKMQNEIMEVVRQCQQ